MRKLTMLFALVMVTAITFAQDDYRNGEIQTLFSN